MSEAKSIRIRLGYFILKIDVWNFLINYEVNEERNEINKPLFFFQRLVDVNTHTCGSLLGEKSESNKLILCEYSLNHLK